MGFESRGEICVFCACNDQPTGSVARGSSVLRWRSVHSDTGVVAHIAWGWAVLPTALEGLRAVLYGFDRHFEAAAMISASNQKIEPVTRSAVAFVRGSTAVDALLVMAHPGRWPSCYSSPQAGDDDAADLHQRRPAPLVRRRLVLVLAHLDVVVPAELRSTACHALYWSFRGRLLPLFTSAA